MGGFGEEGKGRGSAAPLRAVDVIERLEGDMQTLLDLGGVLGEPGLKAWLAKIRRVREAEAARWYPEGRARTRSGRSVRWLREQFARWEAMGYAERRQGKRYYHEAVLPQGVGVIGLDTDLGNATTDSEAA